MKNTYKTKIKDITYRLSRTLNVAIHPKAGIPNIKSVYALDFSIKKDAEAFYGALKDEVNKKLKQ